MKCKTPKLLEDNVGDPGQWLVRCNTKTQSMKEIMIHWTLLKLNFSALQKTTSKNKKTKHRLGGNTKDPSDKELLPKICKNKPPD